MKIHVKFLYIIYFIVFTPFINANGKELIKNDIASLKEAIINNTLTLEKEGSFFDFKTGNSTEYYISEKIKEKGTAYIFSDKQTYTFFLKYLNDVKENPIDKPIDFQSEDGKKYQIYTVYNDDSFTIHIDIVSPTGNNDFPYKEQSYMYTFRSVNGQIKLEKINAAG